MTIPCLHLYSLVTFYLLTSNIFLTITHISCTTVSVCVCLNAHPQGSPRSKTPPVARISSSDWYDIFPCSLHPFRHPLWTTCSIIWLRWMRQVMFSNRCNIKESSIFKSAVRCWYYKLHHLFSSLLTVMFPRYKNKSYADWLIKSYYNRKLHVKTVLYILFRWYINLYAF